MDNHVLPYHDKLPWHIRRFRLAMRAARAMHQRQRKSATARTILNHAKAMLEGRE